MIVYVDRRPAPKRTKPAIWVLDALHPNLERQLRGVMDKKGFCKDEEQDRLSVEKVAELLRGKEVNFIHDRVRPALDRLGPSLKTKNRSLQGKLWEGDLVFVVPAVGKDGEWKSRRPSLPGRPTKVTEEIVAYFFKVAVCRNR